MGKIMSMEEQKKRLLAEFSPNTFDEWAKEAEASLKGKPLDKLWSKTYEGITLTPIYRKEDAEGLPHLENNFPGEFPYVRGTKAEGYKKEAWKIEQDINYTCPREYNVAVKYDLERGQDSVSLNINEDVVDQLISGEAKEFAPATTIINLTTLGKAFDGIDLKKTHIHISSSKYPIYYYALFLAYLKQNNIGINEVNGIFRIDPIGTLARKGELSMSPANTYKATATIINDLVAADAKLRVVEVDSTVYIDGGANAVQEIAYALATAADYLRGIGKEGADVSEIAKRMAFTVGIGSSFFMEMAKMRALRMLWAIVSKEFGANEEGQKIFMHARSSSINKTKLDQYVNMLRVTSESFSAVVAGVDSLTVPTFDYLFGLPKDFSRRIARNTSLFLKEECNLRDAVDPAGGSWYVETLTAELAEKAWKLFQEIEANGGMEKQLMEGKIQEAVLGVKKQRLSALEMRKDVLIGSNKYPNPNEKEVDVYVNNPEEFLKHIKEGEYKSNEAVFANIDASDYSKAIPQLRDAFINGGFVVDVVKMFKGNVITAPKIDCSRLAEPYEEIRANTAAAKEKNGKAPSIFLANMGPLKQHKPRADFSQDFFSTGGYEILYNNGFETPEDAAKAAIESDSKIIVICSTDDTYPDIVPTLAKEVKAKAPEKFIVLAGYPTDYIEAFKEAGVDEFIHVKANIYKILLTVQDKLGLA